MPQLSEQDQLEFWLQAGSTKLDWAQVLGIMKYSTMTHHVGANNTSPYRKSSVTETARSLWLVKSDLQILRSRLEITPKQETHA